MRYQLQMIWSVSWLNLWGAEALDIRQMLTNNNNYKKRSLSHKLAYKKCQHVLSSSHSHKKKYSPQDINHTYTKKKKNVRYVVFYGPHTQTYSFTEIIPDQKVSRAETVRNYSEATPPLRQNITISQKQVQKWLQKHPQRTLRGRVF